MSIIRCTVVLSPCICPSDRGLVSGTSVHPSSQQSLQCLNMKGCAVPEGLPLSIVHKEWEQELEALLVADSRDEAFGAKQTAEQLYAAEYAACGF